ncbi:hypothetical protein JCM11754A_14130 [Isoptericola variabilis]
MNRSGRPRIARPGIARPCIGVSRVRRVVTPRGLSCGALSAYREPGHPRQRESCSGQLACDAGAVLAERERLRQSRRFVRSRNGCGRAGATPGLLTEAGTTTREA